MRNDAGFVVPMTKSQILALFHEVFPDRENPWEGEVKIVARSFAEELLDDGLWALVGRHGTFSTAVTPLLPTPR